MWDEQETEKELEEAGLAFIKREPLSKHTSFKIGGPAAFFCTPDTVEQLRAALHVARKNAVPYYILGKGSNVLFRDEGYPGLIICPQSGSFNAITLTPDGLCAGAAVPLSALCKRALAEGHTGLEFAYGIPGGVGGAVYMNAGAYGGEVKDVLESARILDENGTEQTLPATDLALSYRTSALQQKPWVLLSATFRLPKGDAVAIKAKMDENMQKREDKQPLHLPSAGSAFKRPEGAFAGGLIEQCGLRGFQLGGAAVSEKHCGFIVNTGGATCADVLALVGHVAKTVKEQTGYTLEREIRVVEV